jgi:hypothetical protein
MNSLAQVSSSASFSRHPSAWKLMYMLIAVAKFCGF